MSMIPKGIKLGGLWFRKPELAQDPGAQAPFLRMCVGVVSQHNSAKREFTVEIIGLGIGFWVQVLFLLLNYLICNMKSLIMVNS